MKKNTVSGVPIGLCMLTRLSLARAYNYIFKMPKRNYKKGAKGKGFDKRNNNSNSNNNNNTTTDDNGNWTEAPRYSEVWEKYYKTLNLIPEEEWEAFKTACQTNLPMTFRITGSRRHAEEIRNIFLERHVKNLQGQTFEGIDITPKNIAFYPDNLGWQIDVGKLVIKKQKDFAKTQRFLVLETEVGNISRQEAVSMIPPLLLDVKPHHYVLDMCAAPGSKTAQLVEALHAEDEKKLPTGFVLANDSDYKRSHMLVHQVKRLNSPNFLVVNHDAQLFPRVKLNGEAEYLKYDRILCDVPCSGDATMRKNINVWKDFRVGNALGLHPLQFNILNRGLQLLKRGGRLVYSTCSLSPIENEAVVAEALRRWGKKIKLVNVDNELPGLKRRQGISDWKVFGKDMEIKNKGEDGLPDTLFPPTEEEAKDFNLQNCVRVYPHLQNTGGFFITVFEKLDDEPVKRKAVDAGSESLDAKKPKLADASESNETSTPQPVVVSNDTVVADKPVEMKKTKLPRDANEEPFIFLDPENPKIAECYGFYGFSDSFRKDCTLVRNLTGEPVRTVYYASPPIKELLTIKEQKLKLVHGGIKLFVAQRSESTSCPWRIQTEALHTIEHFVGKERRLKCNLELLRYLFTNGFPKIDEIREQNIDAEFLEGLESKEEGCLFLEVERGNNLEALFLPIWKGRSNVNLMVSKKDTHELLSRVFDIDTSAKDEVKEVIHLKKITEERQEKKDEEAEDTSKD